MIKKQRTKSIKKRKVSRVVAAKCKKSVLRKKTKVCLCKSSQSKLTQLSNYKAFLKYLLSNELDRELADES